MRVLLISESPQVLGGIPTYTVPLAEALCEAGADVSYCYSSSMLQTLALFPGVRLRRHDHQGVQYFDIQNSLRQPSGAARPMMDVRGPQIEKAFVRVLDEVRPDVVHVHSMAGLAASLVELAARHAPVVVTHHEYWWLCARRLLVRSDGRLCAGDTNPAECALCCQDARWWPFVLGSVVDSAFGHGTWRSLVAQIRGGSRAGGTSRTRVESPSSLVGATKLRESTEVHSIRKTALPRILSEVVAVNLAVSNIVRQRLVESGVDETKVQVHHIGTLAGSRVHPIPRDTSPGEATFVTLGGLSDTKGTRVVLGALAEIAGSKAWRALIYGGARADYVAQVTRLSEGLPVTFMGRYRHQDLSEILAEADFVIVAPTIDDTSPQVVFEAFAAGVPVIGARIGGIPDFVQDGVNGLLFNPGDPRDLARALGAVLLQPNPSVYLRDGVKRPRSIEVEAIEMMDLYTNLAHRASSSLAGRVAVGG